VRCAWLTLLLVAVAADAAEGRPAYRVIINPANTITRAERSFVADVFLKKVSRWPGGVVARPVDQAASSDLREKFSQQVLGRSVGAIKSYWQQLIFSGRDTPPAEVDNDAAVIAFILKHPGGIGYVSGAADLSGVKVLAVE
jgi:ABC-type phosphate transport system substrate-binding protein